MIAGASAGESLLFGQPGPGTTLGTLPGYTTSTPPVYHHHMQHVHAAIPARSRQLARMTSFRRGFTSASQVVLLPCPTLPRLPCPVYTLPTLPYTTLLYLGPGYPALLYYLEPGLPCPTVLPRARATLPCVLPPGPGYPVWCTTLGPGYPAQSTPCSWTRATLPRVLLLLLLPGLPCPSTPAPAWASWASQRRGSHTQTLGRSRPS